MSVETEYLLTFGNSVVGSRLHGLGNPQIELVTEPKVIHPFWWKSVIIDGRYTAAAYTWPFAVTLLSSGPMEHIDDFYQLAWLTGSNTTAPTTANTLAINEVRYNTHGSPFAGDVFMSFGPCFFAGASHVEPGDVLVTDIGIVEVRFKGATTPVLEDEGGIFG